MLQIHYFYNRHYKIFCVNKKYGTHTESRILHLHKIFYSANIYKKCYTMF